MKPYYDHGGITICLGDCREVLLELEADLVLEEMVLSELEDLLYLLEQGPAEEVA